MTLAAGSKLGPYEMVAPPGSPRSRAAISFRLFGLTHFNSAKG
jgi:hypothetical protein